MNSKRACFLGVFLLFVAAFLPARGNREKAVKPPAPVVQVTGIVRLVGNEPFTELVVSNSEDTWHIAKEDQNKLNDLQHRTVTVEGEETVIELKFASGIPAGTRRELRNIRIIKEE